MGLAIHEGGLRKPLGQGAAGETGRLQGQDDPRPAVAGAGRRASRRSARTSSRCRCPRSTQALQNGTVDGVEANLPLIYTASGTSRPSSSPATSTSGPSRPCSVINKAVYDGLTADQQTALTDAAANITEDSIEIFTTPGSTVAQDLVTAAIKYVIATEADKAALTQGGEGAISEPRPREPGLRDPDPGRSKEDPAGRRPRRRRSPRPRPGSASRPPDRLDPGPAAGRGMTGTPDPAPRGGRVGRCRRPPLGHES